MVDVDVTFEVGGETFSFPQGEAVVMAEELRLKAVGQRGTEGREGALAVADAIEDVLVERTTSPIPLEGEASEAIFYLLNVQLVATQEAQWGTEGFRLFRAVRVLHDERLRP